MCKRQAQILFFFLLLLVVRLNTRELLKRKKNKELSCYKVCYVQEM
jgi:hypothetical protein